MKTNANAAISSTIPIAHPNRRALSFPPRWIFGASSPAKPVRPSLSSARELSCARALGGFSCLGAEPARGEGEVTERGQQQQRGIRVRCVNKLVGEHHRRAKWVDLEVRVENILTETSDSVDGIKMDSSRETVPD